jgi:uncharacterized damage-inducible protein DinB
MELKQLFLEQLEREAASSRKVIERVPEGQNGWKPHERSMEMGYLAALVATMPGWPALMIDRDELNLADPANEIMRVKAVETRAELLSLLDEALAKSRKSLEGTTEEHLLKPWRLRINEKVASEGPRYMMIAESALTHMAHHRGQLTVYLRLNDAKVPAVYGPSADERF